MPRRTLRPETEDDRNLQAKVTPADVAELRSRMEVFSTDGQVLNEAGMVEKTKPEVTQELFFATKANSGVTGAFLDWLKDQES